MPSTILPLLLISLASTAPFAMANSGTGSEIRARWGQAAAIDTSENIVYFTGGEITLTSSSSSSSSSSIGITNEVLSLDLNSDNPQLTTMTSSSFPATAYHSMAYATTNTSGGSGSETRRLVTFGGMTSNCASDKVLHTLNLGDESSMWTTENVSGLIRRRGMGMQWLEDEEQLIIVGGVADQYVCASSTYSYPAFDRFPLSFSNSDSTSTSEAPTIVHTEAISTILMGGTLPIADFSLTNIGDDTLVLAGGSDSSGNLIQFDKIALYTPQQGWHAISTSGDIPSPRAGHTMVKHPSMDILIMHGGSTFTSDSSSSSNPSGNPSTLTTFLNTTSWAWSTLSGLQPSSNYARAWHSAVMSNSGVMITAFGLSVDSQPRNDVVYLDMRDSDASEWSWKSDWSAAMVNSTVNINNLTTVLPNASSAAANANASDNQGSSNHTKKTVSIVVPVVLICAFAIPLLLWFGRKHLKILRQRQMARHFEIDPSSENVEKHAQGNVSSGSGFSNPLTQFLASRKRNGDKRASLPRPYGGIRLSDQNEVQARSIKSILTSGSGWYNKARGQTPTNEGQVRRTQQDGENSNIEKNPLWEEIDFGLGKIDESRQSPLSARPSARAGTNTNLESNNKSTPSRKSSQAVRFADQAHHQTIRPVPAPVNHLDDDTSMSNHLSVSDYPTLGPVHLRSPQQVPDFNSPNFASPLVPTTSDYTTLLPANNDMSQHSGWNDLASDLITNPPFKSEDAETKSLDNPVKRRNSALDAPRPDSSASSTILPPLDFQERPSSPVFGDGPLAYPFANQKHNKSRSVSQPQSSGRSLVPTAALSQQAEPQVNQIPRHLVDALGITTTRNMSSPPRSSRAPLPPPPTHSLPVPPRAAKQNNKASGDVKRESKDSQLRVVNSTPSPSNVQREW